MSIIILLLFQQAGEYYIGGPRESAVETTIINLVQWLKLLIETIGAVIICIGAAVAVYEFIRALRPPRIDGFNRIRLTLARYLALALEFQLGADILSTAVAPTWEQIGKLGAIAVIRTALNYFLMREMKEERQTTEETDKTSGPPQHREPIV
jgi:uncharacterized membrane protein